MVATMRVTPDQRHTRRNRCPVCGGGHDDPHGRGIRCYGFTSGDRLYAHCTREDLAGALRPDPDGKTWPHRLHGPCGCGVTHGERSEQSGEGAADHQRTSPSTYPSHEALPDVWKGKQLARLWSYLSADGEVVYEIRRYNGADGAKVYVPFTPLRDGRWTPKLETERVLYRLPELIAARLDAPVIICEGEKCADVARAALRVVGMDWPVTTSSFGAKSGHLTSLDALKGRQVVILRDNDDDGASYAKTIATGARTAGATKVAIVLLKGLKPHGDVADWLAAGHDGSELERVITGALAGDSQTDGSDGSDGSTHSTDEEEPIGASAWPVLDEAALYGLPGELVRLIEPHTEADPVALLIQILIYFGNAVGRSAFFRVEAQRHYANLFAALAGDTAKARKGTSEGWVESAFTTRDAELEEWRKYHVLSGLTSGEGLIHAVRDLEEGTDETLFRTHEKKLMRDKRLLVRESEFGAMLRIMGRDGNSLSGIIRDAWDGRTLRTMGKRAPEVATGAHISIVGHVTSGELLKYLSATESSNGFGNRFLWLCVKRSKRLPEGGSLPEDALVGYRDRLAKAIRVARTREVMKRDEAARALWIKEYEDLSEGVPGLFGDMVARSEAQVTRLALLYALFDEADKIREPHLEAALALWRYCEASARYLFGDKLADPVAETIMRGLQDARDKGLTRTEISHRFKGHTKSNDITRALAQLRDQGRAACEEVPTGGRSIERWRTAKYAKQANQAKDGAGADEASGHLSPLSHNSHISQFACPACGNLVGRDYGDGFDRCTTCDEPMVPRGVVKVPVAPQHDSLVAEDAKDAEQACTPPKGAPEAASAEPDAVPAAAEQRPTLLPVARVSPWEAHR